MWNGTVVLALPFPADGTDLTGQKMAGQQSTVVPLFSSAGHVSLFV
jgi:hypothetical protein